MIKSFAHKGLERFFTNGDKSGINAQYGDRIRSDSRLFSIRVWSGFSRSEAVP